MKELTKAEEQVMQYLWKLKKGFAKDILRQFCDPKPAYSTVATIIKILVDKGFISYKVYGKTYEYYPLVSSAEYRKKHFKKLVKNYFSNSYKLFTTFFSSENDLSVNELEEIKRIVEAEIQKKKQE